MGLTRSKQVIDTDYFNIEKKPNQFIIGLAGNPNTGKSSIFNLLTGLNQHTGNWPGKTISNARGNFKHSGRDFIIVDVPGTYSLFGLSDEEVVARDFICFGKADIIIIVTDATALERNLNLVFQVLEVHKKVIMVVNLMDEARKKHITIDQNGLKKKMGIPIVFTSTKTKEGIKELKDEIVKMINEETEYKPIVPAYSVEIESQIEGITMMESINRYEALRIIDGDQSYFDAMRRCWNSEANDLIAIKDKYDLDTSRYREEIITINYRYAEKIIKTYVKENKEKHARDQLIDDIITSKRWGILLMLLLLFVVFFITLKLANYPSELLFKSLFYLESKLYKFLLWLSIPRFLTDLFILGIYRTVAWVVAVMLPPMAIFFPLFTLLEDLGYLPRVAFNLDHKFKKVCAHGKQCLSMCMGFGCNAAGVTGTRIIDSPREKLIAIITNTFVPCNGRFPTIMVIASACFAVTSSIVLNSLMPALVVVIIIVLGVITTLLVSLLLSKTILKGEASTFTLELPPYRKPKFWKTIYTSLIDRTIRLLGRAALIAAPFGGLIWILANLNIGDVSLLTHLSTFLNPLGKLIGLDGIILLGFILAFPANEIVLPVVIMGYLQAGHLIDFDSTEGLRQVFVNNNWTILTAINFLLFSLLHWPCSTTLLTIKKETGSWKWTFISFLIPTLIAIATCLITNGLYQMIK